MQSGSTNTDHDWGEKKANPGNYMLLFYLGIIRLVPTQSFPKN